MTEHLTRHGTDHDDDYARDDVSRDDARDGTTEVPDQERTEFREPGTDTDRDTDRGTGDLDRGTGEDQNLSTADLASASAGPDTAGSAADTGPAQSGGDVETPPLIDEDKVTGFRDRWQNVQTGFVDDPKQAVQQADELVAAVISALATTFAEHKSELEAQWQQGEPATEELRIALRRYRSFFDQLLPH